MPILDRQGAAVMGASLIQFQCAFCPAETFHFYGVLKFLRYQGSMEKRAAPRKPVLMSGAIEFAAGVISCLISNISISGAAIEVTDPHDIPDRFNLVFKADDTHIPCRVVWRQDERIGVTFD